MSDKSFMADFLEKGFAFLNDISRKLNEAEKKTEEEGRPQLLTAEKIRELKWMSPRQLAAIYQHGGRKTHIADDPDAYRELKWMSPSQLDAIFGKDGFN